MQKQIVAYPDADLAGLPDWHAYWNCSTEKKGYSGTALLSRHAHGFEI